MRIALINEDSCAECNAAVAKELAAEALAAGHEFVNLGMTSADDPHQINFTQLGIMAAVVLETGVANFVVTGCGTGQGAMISLNAFSNVVCGYVREPLDVYLFTQVNAGNAISLPLAQGFGWGAEVNLRYIFRALFGQEFGGGYPEVHADGEAQSRVRMAEATKAPAQRPLIEALGLMDHEVLRDLFNYPMFQKAFEAYAVSCETTSYLRSLLAG